MQPAPHVSIAKRHGQGCKPRPASHSINLEKNPFIPSIRCTKCYGYFHDKTKEIFMFKQIQFIILCGLLFLPNSVFARDCSYVAKIHSLDKIDHVGILRKNAKLPEWASKENRFLCAGDTVIAPKAVSKIIVEYYTNPTKQVKLNAGETYEVGELRSLCEKWCKLVAEIGYFYDRLTQTETSFVSSIPVFCRGEDGQLKPIFMPLARGEGADYEFFLFAQAGGIPLFWLGGEPDYQLWVKDATGKVIVDKTVKTNRYNLKLPSTAEGQRYELSISCRACKKVYRKPLVFVAPPPLPIENHFKVLSALSLDEDNNWRLEIWRQLAKMPKSKARNNFQQILILDYLDKFIDSINSTNSTVFKMEANFCK